MTADKSREASRARWGGARTAGATDRADAQDETTLAHRFARWVARNVVADDPAPEYSALDRRDGLDTRH